jgi:hypothetical protein
MKAGRPAYPIEVPTRTAHEQAVLGRGAASLSSPELVQEECHDWMRAGGLRVAAVAGCAPCPLTDKVLLSDAKRRKKQASGLGGRDPGPAASSQHSLFRILQSIAGRLYLLLAWSYS